MHSQAAEAYTPAALVKLCLFPAVHAVRHSDTCDVSMQAGRCDLYGAVEQQLHRAGYEPFLGCDYWWSCNMNERLLGEGGSAKVYRSASSSHFQDMHYCLFSTQICNSIGVSQSSWHMYPVFVTGRCAWLCFPAGCAELQTGSTLEGVLFHPLILLSLFIVVIVIFIIVIVT